MLTEKTFDTGEVVNGGLGLNASQPPDAVRVPVGEASRVR